MIQVEYLLPFNTKDGICRDIKSFNSLLSSNADITINKNKIIYKGSTYNYSIELSIVENQDCSVYHITIEPTRITDKFRELVKTIKRTVGVHLKDDIQIIWDGIAFEWSKDLYPKIYQIENSMRKLISKFMLINLGTGWHKKSIPREVIDSIKNDSPKGHGVLYESDFIQLSHFLFQPYSTKDISKLPEAISDVLKIKGPLTDQKKEEITAFIPKNNWDRYFYDVVKTESEQLKKKWEKLYEIRCIVAHNKSMTHDQYEEGLSLISFLEPIINNAIKNLSKIEIPEEDKETVSLNTIATVHEPARVFIKDYNSFNNGLVNTFLNNTDRFPGTLMNSNPIGSLLSSSSLVNYMSDPLKVTLGSIASTKDLILGGESFNTLNRITANTSNLFGAASSQILNDFNITNPSESILDFASRNYAIPVTPIKKIEEEEE